LDQIRFTMSARGDVRASLASFLGSGENVIDLLARHVVDVLGLRVCRSTLEGSRRHRSWSRPASC
jgi:hypothetical protein